MSIPHYSGEEWICKCEGVGTDMGGYAIDCCAATLNGIDWIVYCSLFFNC